MSFINCISKLLASRIKIVLPSLISESQTAFVPKRIIGDNIMLAQALCKNYHLNSGSPRCAFKLDITKAFDTLSWSFLFTALEKMKFPTLFISWIRMCVTSAMFSVKINGSI